MRARLMHAVYVPAGVILGVACAAASAQPRTDAEQGNFFYQYSNTKLAEVCEAMSPNTYASGLTDGVILSVPGAGRTYFYKSTCYMELARRTNDLAVCHKVRQRKPLIGDGSSVSPAVCEKMVQSAQIADAKSKSDWERQSAFVKGAYKITSASATVLPNGNWQITLQAEGNRAGAYWFEAKNGRNNKELAKVEVQLAGDGSTLKVIQQQITIDRASLIGSTALPAIFPTAYYLHYRLPPGSDYPLPSHQTSIQNLTLSAQ